MANIIVNGFNVGTELQSVILQADTGVSIPVEYIGHLQELSVDMASTARTIEPCAYGGKRLHRNIYHDWSGHLSFERFNGDITNMMLGILNRFQQTGYETYWTVTGNIFNSTLGTNDEMQLMRVVFDQFKAGSFNGSSQVSTGWNFRAQSLSLTGSSANVLFNGPTVAPATSGAGS